MSIQLMIMAALFIAASNFCLRRSIDSGGTSKAYLMIQLSLTFVIAILLNPVRTGDYTWSTPMAYFAMIEGLMLGSLMLFLGKALELGPPGLTFAALNSATVMPSLVMVAVFGASFGYTYTLFNAIGSVLVIIGLFWAGWGAHIAQNKMRWIIFTFGSFTAHMLFLILVAWRALIINFPGANPPFIPFASIDANNQWFMPVVFCVAALMQIVIYFSTQSQLPSRCETLYGAIGSMAYAAGFFFLIWSSEVATSFEHALLFPIFSVTIIIICNLWGKYLYQEKINWAANGCCVLGILIGTVDWKVLL